MHSVTYDWTRYWCPREGYYSLEDEGFLYVPVSEYSFGPTDIQTLEAMAAQPCLVLLGEPGIGKSFATRSEFERLEAATVQGSQDRVLWFDLRTFGTEDPFSPIGF